MKTQTLESKAFDKAFGRVRVMSNNSLLDVWKAANSESAHPEYGWGTFIDRAWVVIPWDEWCNILSCEMSRRGLSPE
jgi:hypothetical protein